MEFAALEKANIAYHHIQKQKKQENKNKQKDKKHTKPSAFLSNYPKEAD
jgi:hypothetical protein